MFLEISSGSGFGCCTWGFVTSKVLMTGAVTMTLLVVGLWDNDVG
jgi:hypothetical protein